MRSTIKHENNRDMSKCNFCTLETIRKHAAFKGKDWRVTVIQDASGVDVYMHDKHIVIEELSGYARLNHHIVWFESLTSTCVCKNNKNGTM
jgi:hypothetical protein